MVSGSTPARGWSPLAAHDKPCNASHRMSPDTTMRVPGQVGLDLRHVLSHRSWRPVEPLTWRTASTAATGRLSITPAGAAASATALRRPWSIRPRRHRGHRWIGLEAATGPGGVVIDIHWHGLDP